MKALIVIDMLNGFCRNNYPLSLPDSTTSIEGYIASRIIETLEQKGAVFFVCDSHSDTDPEIGQPYPPHCMEGTAEAEIIDELKPLAEKSTVLKKHTLSIFLDTGLENLLADIKPTEVEVAGVCTEICDLFAVYELRIRNYNVFVSRKGVLPLHPSEQSTILEYMETHLGARVE